MRLDEREERMLQLIVKGHRAAGIADAVGLTEGTVRVYLSNLYQKIGAKDMTAAAVWFMKREARRAK